MRLPQIINSLLETDMYKFSMGQTIFHQFTSYKTTWTFKCRNKDVHFTDEMVEEIKEQVQAFCQLRFTEEELEYLDNITWIKGTYVDFLRLWQPRYEEFTITTDAPCGLAIDAAGTWLNTSMYEIPVLAIVNEVYFRMAYDYDVLLKAKNAVIGILAVDIMATANHASGCMPDFTMRVDIAHLYSRQFEHSYYNYEVYREYFGTKRCYSYEFLMDALVSLN